MIGLMKFLQGFVKIKITGYSPERFMNLCSNHHMLLWGIEHHGTSYVMYMSIPSFFRIKPFLKKTNTKVVLLEKHGLPFFVPTMIKRKVFIGGLVGILLTMVVLTQFIWGFELTGNTTITDEYLLDYLKEKGIWYGTPKSELELQGIEDIILSEFPMLSWTSVTLEGTTLQVSVKENEYYESDLAIQQSETDKITSEICTNLVASQEGVVVSIVTRAGVPQVTVGENVVAGDILVEGNIPIYNDDGSIVGYQYTNSDATIQLQTTYDFKEEVQMTYEGIMYTEQSYSNYFIEIGGKMFHVIAHSNPYLQFDSYTQKYQVQILDHFYLPIYYGSTQVREYQITQLIRSELEGTAYLEEKLKEYIESFQEKGVQIIENNVKIEILDDCMIAEGEVVVLESCVEPIGVDIEELESILQIEEEIMQEQTDEEEFEN
ncbi:MAG: sporulation protein YqfD [Eubacteriales bacterium]